jgi:predicted Zn-dependent protease
LARDFENSDNPAYLDTLGWVYFKRGDLESSERVLKRAVERAPKSALLQYHLAKVLMDRGNAQEALAHLETAIASGQRFAGVEDARSMRDRLTQS